MPRHGVQVKRVVFLSGPLGSHQQAQQGETSLNTSKQTNSSTSRDAVEHNASIKHVICQAVRVDQQSSEDSFLFRFECL